MSERKRLSDDEVGVLHAGIQAAHGARWKVLAADHLQAREDVKRLVAGLLETSGWEAPTGGDRCWCHDGPCFRSEDNRATDEMCGRLSALLSEVTTP